MKSNIIHLVWNALNTCAIILIAGWINVSLYIPDQLGKKVDKMEIELEAYKNMSPDSITIHIDNHINIPQPKKEK